MLVKDRTTLKQTPTISYLMYCNHKSMTINDWILPLSDWSGELGGTGDNEDFSLSYYIGLYIRLGLCVNNMHGLERHVEPVGLAAPVGSTWSVESVGPVEPVWPVGSVRPTWPVGPVGIVGAVGPVGLSELINGLSVVNKRWRDEVWVAGWTDAWSGRYDWGVKELEAGLRRATRQP